MQKIQIRKMILAGAGAAAVLGGMGFGVVEAGAAPANPVTPPGVEVSCGSTTPGSPVLTGAACDWLPGRESVSFTVDADGTVRDESGNVVAPATGYPSFGAGVRVAPAN
jgi:hypothetical protein